MLNHPDTQDEAPQSGKLVLPAPPDEEVRTYSGQYRARLRPEQLIRQQVEPIPNGLLARVSYYWRKDPAYKVFMLAIAMVLIAGIIFVSLASAAILRNPSWNSAFSSTSSTGAAPSGTADLRPSFPTPGGGSGSSQSSQPPVQKTPALQPTQEASPTGQQDPTPNPGGNLTVQITSIPPVVANFSRVDVGVTTSEPGVKVWLQIRYNVAPGQTTAGPQITDNNGNATITWAVVVYGFGHKAAQAKVTAVATDQNGQTAFSAPVTVQIITGQ